MGMRHDAREFSVGRGGVVMTTPTTANGIELRLPHYHWRHNRHTPTTPREFAQWAIEELVSEYGDSGNETLLDIAYWTHCRHLTWAEFFEKVERLCAISQDVDEWETKPGHDARKAFEAYRDDYTTHLTALVTPPSDRVEALADAVHGDEVADELARRRR